MVENAKLDRLLPQVNCRITSITRLGRRSDLKPQGPNKSSTAVELRAKFMRQIRTMTMCARKAALAAEQVASVRRRPRPFLHATLKIDEIPVNLLEREAEREELLGLGDRQRARQPLAAERRDL